MVWLILSLLTATFEAGKDLFSKQNLEIFDSYAIAWILTTLTGLLLIPVLLLLGVPTLGDRFWWALLAGGSLNIIAILLYMKALESSDLSLSVPMITFTPLFLLFTSPLIVGEIPTVKDGVGVCFIVGGAYVLKLEARRRGYWAPLRALWKERGPKFMLGVAFIWSITSNIDKIGIQNSSPIGWAMAIFLFNSLIFLPVMLQYSDGSWRAIPRHWRPLLRLGICGALSISCQTVALTLTSVVHVISIKRLSVPLGVLFGHFILGERKIEERLSGAIAMVFGVFLIAS
ncbi:MAG: EamA family transporter [Limnospira sp.]